MKRMHIHVGVEDLTQSVEFYSALFGSDPDKLKSDYARWLLDDPRVNFAISTNIETRGVEHLGLQVDSSEELEGVRSRLKHADQTLYAEGETTCCYANSDKSWVRDPSGVAWESFMTHSDADEYFGKEQPATNEWACC